MPVKSTALLPQNATRKNLISLRPLSKQTPDTLTWWIEQYFDFEVTSGESSRKVQRRDLNLFVEYMFIAERTDSRIAWTPRLSKAFQEYLNKQQVGGQRRWAERSINRVLSHLKTFAKWAHKLCPFPLGNPMEKIRIQPLGTGLEIERALTVSERRRILDAADQLEQIGGRSRDRSRFRGVERPKRKGYRALRNRAIVYALVETGMRRAAVTKLDVDRVDFRKKLVSVEEKGGLRHSYHISNEGLHAISDYMRVERPGDVEKWKSSALFLATASNSNGNGRLTVKVINDVWNEVCEFAGVEAKTPHSARHAMGKHIMEKTGNVAAVQRQLGHKNAAYSMQYSRVTAEELRNVINDR